MSKDDNQKYVLVKDGKGQKFFCTINAGEDPSSIRIDETDDCVEEDVIGRYAGNINIKTN